MAHHLRNVEDQYLGGVVLKFASGNEDDKKGRLKLNVKIRMSRYIPNKWYTLDYVDLGDKTGIIAIAIYLEIHDNYTQITVFNVLLVNCLIQ